MPSIINPSLFHACPGEVYNVEDARRISLDLSKAKGKVFKFERGGMSLVEHSFEQEVVRDDKDFHIAKEATGSKFFYPGD